MDGRVDGLFGSCVDEVVSHGRLRGYGLIERKDKSDWVSACRKYQVERTKSKGRSRKMWNEFVKVDMIRRGLFKDDAHNRDK